MPKKGQVPYSYEGIIGGKLHVLVQWEDPSKGGSHYVPIAAIKGHHCGGSRVTMIPPLPGRAAGRQAEGPWPSPACGQPARCGVPRPRGCRPPPSLPGEGLTGCSRSQSSRRRASPAPVAPRSFWVLPAASLFVPFSSTQALRSRRKL